MNKDVARQYLTCPQNRKPSEIGEAVDALYAEYGTYDEMAAHFTLSSTTLSYRHRIFKLPEGIRWKVDEGKIKIGSAVEISRLKNEDDQWLLAFSIIDENLDYETCKSIVTRVLTYNDSMADALRNVASIGCDKVDTLLVPLTFQERLALSRQAWSDHNDWDEFCHQLLRKGDITRWVRDYLQTIGETTDSLSSRLQENDVTV